MFFETIESTVEIEAFVDKHLLLYYQHRLEEDDGSVIFVSVIVKSPFLDTLLHKAIAESEQWNSLIAFDCSDLWRKVQYPKEVRLYFCSVNCSRWPTNNHLGRSDCSSLLCNTVTIESKQDVVHLRQLFLHNWHMRAQRPEPHYWYQDVEFFNRALLLEFLNIVWCEEALHCSLLVAPFHSGLDDFIRFYFDPWHCSFGHVATGEVAIIE